MLCAERVDAVESAIKSLWLAGNSSFAPGAIRVDFQSTAPGATPPAFAGGRLVNCWVANAINETKKTPFVNSFTEKMLPLKWTKEKAIALVMNTVLYIASLVLIESIIKKIQMELFAHVT